MEDKSTLHYQELVALEGEVSMFLSTAPHDEEMLYRIFMLLETVPDNIYNYLVNEIKEQVEIKEETLNLVILQAREHEVPVWLWLDRCVADIKLYLSGGELPSSPFKLSINKKVARKKIIRSAFCMFIRRIGLINSLAARQLVSHVLHEDELNFLHGICLVLSDQLDILDRSRPPKKIVGRDILDISFDMKEILNFNRMLEYKESELGPEEEENLLLELNQIEEDEDENYQLIPQEQLRTMKKALNSIVEQLSKLPEGTLEEIPSGKIKVVEKTDEKYVVFKKQDKYNTMLKMFNTEEEAERYIEEIKEKAPDLKAEFEIKKVESKHIWGRA